MTKAWSSGAVALLLSLSAGGIALCFALQQGPSGSVSPDDISRVSKIISI